MRLFTDESGTPSISDCDTQPYFTVGCLLSENPAVLDAWVREFKSERGLALNKEIKFNKASHDRRRDFLQELLGLDIRVSVLVVPKQAILDRYTQIKPGLYQYGVAIALDHALSDCVCEHVLIDNYLNSKVPNLEFKAYLRQSVNAVSYRASDFGVGDSKKHNCLQAADMITGAVAIAHKDGIPEYRHIIRTILDEHVWQEK